MKKKHEIKWYSSNFMIPRRVKVDDKDYVLEEEEVKMLREKFKEIYDAYVDQNVDYVLEEKE